MLISSGTLPLDGVANPGPVRISDGPACLPCVLSVNRQVAGSTPFGLIPSNYSPHLVDQYSGRGGAAPDGVEPGPGAPSTHDDQAGEPGRAARTALGAGGVARVGRVGAEDADA